MFNPKFRGIGTVLQFMLIFDLINSVTFIMGMRMIDKDVYQEETALN